MPGALELLSAVQDTHDLNTTVQMVLVFLEKWMDRKINDFLVYDTLFMFAKNTYTSIQLMLRNGTCS